MAISRWAIASPRMRSWLDLCPPEMLLYLLLRIHLGLALTNARRVPRKSEIAGRSIGVLVWRRASDNNYLEGRGYRQTCTTAANND